MRSKHLCGADICLTGMWFLSTYYTMLW